MSQRDAWEKSVPSRGNGKCKGPEVGIFQVCLRNNKEARIIADLMLIFLSLWILQKGLLDLYASVLLVCL